MDQRRSPRRGWWVVGRLSSVTETIIDNEEF